MTPETKYFLELVKDAALGLLLFAIHCGVIFGLLYLVALLVSL